MAEFILIVGIAANFIAVVEFGGKVVSRIKEYREKAGELPETLIDVEAVVTLTTQAVQSIQQQLVNGKASAESQKAVDVVLQRCKAKLKELSELLEKLLSPISSSFRVVYRAVRSLHEDKKIAKLLEGIRKLVDILTFYQVSPLAHTQTATVKTQRVHFLVPSYHINDFIGRKGLLKMLNESLRIPDRHNRFAIFGQAGIGKTRIVREYAEQFRGSTSTSVFWIHCGSIDKFGAGCKDMAATLGLSIIDKGSSASLIMKWLDSAESGDWILVLDNVDDSETIFGERGLERYLPTKAQGSILLTTRSLKVAVGFSVDRTEVKPFDKAEAEEFLSRKIVDDDSDVEDRHALARELCFVPLALAQAAAFIASNSISCQGYLQIYCGSDASKINLLSAEFEEPGQHGRDPFARYPIIKTWEVTFNYLATAYPFAAELLSFSAMLDEQAIPQRLLSQAVNKGADQTDIVVALGTLQAYSMMSRRKVKAGVSYDQLFDLHPLVRLATWSWLDERGTLAKHLSHAILCFCQRLPEPMFNDPQVWAPYQSHATKVLDSVSKLGFKPHPSTTCQGEGMQLSNTPDPENFTTHVSKKHDDSKNVCRVCYATLNCLASRSYASAGTYETSLSLAREGLALRQELLTPDNKDVIDGLNQVSYILTRLGGLANLRDAENTALKGLAILEKRPDLRETHLEMRYVLAITLQNQSRLPEALQELQELLELYSNFYGAGHQKTFKIISALAFTYYLSCEYEKAKEFQEQVLKEFSKSLGADHPVTIANENRLALTLGQLGEFKRAFCSLKSVVGRAKTALGPLHPDTLVAMSNLAQAHLHCGQVEEALSLALEVLRLRRQILGERNLLTGVSKGMLAEIYEKMEKWEEALDLWLEVDEHVGDKWLSDSEIQNVRAHRDFCSRVQFAERNNPRVSIETKKERNGVLWQSVCEKYPRAAKVPKNVSSFSGNNFGVGWGMQLNVGSGMQFNTVSGSGIQYFISSGTVTFGKD